MKIFMSHSSRQKLFVKELRKYLPHHLNLWIDEREILLGASLNNTINESIDSSCDYFVLIIDHLAVKSEWVKIEIEIALNKEKKLGRVFLLPIVLDKDAWETWDFPDIKNRKYLSCLDFTDIAIESIAKNLSSEILGWLCKEFEKKKDIVVKSDGEKNIGILKEADTLLRMISGETRKIVLPHRRNNPLSVELLCNKLRDTNKFKNIKDQEFKDIFIKLRDSGGLKGVFYDGEKMFLQRETYEYKADLYKTLKKKIANKAFELIEPEQIIAIDGGSTTLELSVLIAASLKLNELYGLKIITNSLTAVCGARCSNG
jgi:hypothetical protein